MSAHVSSFGITFSPNERIIYRDSNNEPTTKERARFVVLQRFYDDGLLKEEIIEDLEPQTQRSTTGFMGMLDPAYQHHISRESSETHKLIPCGFLEMLESAFPNGKTGNLTTEHEKPCIQRGMGFAAMLEGARRGTE